MHNRPGGGLEMKKLSLSYGILTTAAFLVLTAFTEVDGPEINVKNSGDIPDGRIYNYGSVNVKGSKSVTFRIENSGGIDLSLEKGADPECAIAKHIDKPNLQKLPLQDYLHLAGPNANQFRVVQQPTSPIAPDTYTEFIIAFEPTTTGFKYASISIDNNDADENPYNIYFTGEGYNTQPTISDIPNQTTPEDTPTPPIPFTVNDAEQSPDDLVVNAKSNNIALIPNMNIVLGGFGTNRTITLTPSPNAYGVATIVVSVSDGIVDGPNVVILGKNHNLKQMDYTQTSFIIEVTPVNDLPTITDIPDQTTNQDTPTPPIPFTIDDIETDPTALIVTGSSSDQTLVPDANIVFGTTALAKALQQNRTITISPAAGQSGTTTITITVSDGEDVATDTFVLAVNGAPYFLGPLLPITLVQGQHYGIPIGLLYLLVDDPDDADADRIWSIEPNPIFSPTVTADSILFDAPTNWLGTEILTVTVSDGALSASEELTVTVIEATSAVGATPDMPEKFQLSQNYPNPFNPSTTISYALPRESHVILTMYSMTGQSIQVLVDEFKNAGYHTVQWDASVLGSGIYFYRIQAGDFTMVKKCTLMK